MRLWIVSDLHTEAWPWTPKHVPEHDVLVVAGDIGGGTIDAVGELIRLRRIAGAKPIVFVPGNHDHFDDTLEAFADMNVDGVHILHSGQSVIINGVRFVGATLWTDWWLHDTEFASQAWAARHMPEYNHVHRSDGETIWPVDTSNAHDLHRARIEQSLSQRHEGPTVVVTHHAPSPRSLRPPIEEADAAFASDLEDLIVRHQPDLWMHGHIHLASDYTIGRTRIVCNPRGYQSADWYERTEWTEDLVVEV